ncbi:hypothetical protein GLU64_00675 [Nanohaloarchaea archaeon]|nr:hypothetical protein [Candidatus Nanohaloarchaea archaeon]
MAGLSALTIASAGVIEKNNVFNEKMFELRVRELANVIDTMALYENGEMTMHLAGNWTMEFSGASGLRTLKASRDGASANATLDIKPDEPSTGSLKAQIICISKSTNYNPPSGGPPRQELKVSRGEC